METSAAERALRMEHRGKRLLLADDNAVNREVTLELLRDVGFVVDIAMNGVEAVEQAKRGKYALVLMDMQMPDMDGLEATRTIRMLAGWADIPIIAMTANAFGEDRSACLAAGMNDHLGKPATPVELYSMLLKWFDTGAPSAADRAADKPPAIQEKPAAAATAQDAPPCFDVPKLLALFGQNTATVRRLLQLAATEHKDDAARLADSASRGDFATATKIAHRIKGTASGIEAKALYTCAGDAETNWRRDSAIDPVQLKALIAALNALLADIDRYLARS
jgi:CheY-like chemotaxis protein